MEDENSLFKYNTVLWYCVFMKVNKVTLNIVDKTNTKPLSKCTGFNYKEFFLPQTCCHQILMFRKSIVFTFTS